MKILIQKEYDRYIEIDCQGKPMEDILGSISIVEKKNNEYVETEDELEVVILKEKTDGRGVNVSGSNL